MKSAGTQPQPSRQHTLTNNAQKMQVVSKTTTTYAVPTHRRSNTAASFVPQMTLKQFQEQKNAALANNQAASRQKLNKSQVNSFDMRASVGVHDSQQVSLAAHVEAATSAATGRVSNASGLTERRGGANQSLQASKSSNLAVMKKFEMNRRDKSQPEAFYHRNSNNEAV